MYGDHSCTDIEPDLDVFFGNNGSSTSEIAFGIDDEIRIRVAPHFLGNFLIDLKN